MIMWWWLHIIGSCNPHDIETCVTWTWERNSIAVTVIVAGMLTVCESLSLFTYSCFSLQPNAVCCLCHLFRGKTNYINLGSFLIKPVQRVMRYPLLLMELLGATPESHHDRPQLTQALQAVKEINVNINEYKRRKDLGKDLLKPAGLSVFGKVFIQYKVWTVFPLLPTVVKYRKGDGDTFIDKISKLSMHSIIKKSNRVSSHLKHLTGMSPQVHHCSLLSS